MDRYFSSPHTLKTMAAGPDNALYVLGGTDGIAFYDDLWRFDLYTHSWSLVLTVGCRPSPR